MTIYYSYNKYRHTLDECKVIKASRLFITRQYDILGGMTTRREKRLSESYRWFPSKRECVDDAMKINRDEMCLANYRHKRDIEILTENQLSLERLKRQL